MRNRTKHCVGNTVALLLTAVITFSATDITAFAKESKWSGDEITISTEKEWNKLAKYCEKDSYSVGKTISLTEDLQLSEKAKMIPYFAGTFQGNNHTIEGEFTDVAESVQGLFLHTAPEAVIQDVHIKITLDTEGKQEKIGGIAADHQGTIIGCSMEGVISGDTDVGGIAGINGITGQIIDCTSEGMVIGVYNTGGIAGRNLGTIYGCENQAAVNTEITRETVDLTTFQDSIYKAWKSYSMEETLPSSSDAGGIAGFSKGIVSHCTNVGNVGYSHVGYNVGGIIGRQCGYVENCINQGMVKGRKDVGGVVGQAVPEVTLAYGDDTIETLKKELGELQVLLKQTSQDGESASKVVSNRLDKIMAYADVASDSAQKIGEKTREDVDFAREMLDDTSAKVMSYTRRMQGVAAEIEVASASLEKAQTELNSWYKEYSDKLAIEQSMNDLNASIDTAQNQAGTITGGGSTLPTAEDIQKLQAAIDDMRKTIATIEKKLSIASDAMTDFRLKGAMEQLQKASESISRASKEASAILEDWNSENNGTLEVTDDTVEKESQRLQGAMTGISDQLTLLNTEMTGESDRLMTDINQVGDKFVSIMNLLIDAIEETQSMDVEDVYQDVSEETINQTTQGKVLECQNQVTIEGDVNVGGIVGNMAIEYDQDPEDDLNEAEENRYRRTYQTKAIIQNCNNNGKVSGKKNCVGGIAGRMDLGILMGCYSGGNIESTTGDYVGGVCGYALSIIRKCSSKATVSGKDYVAGIAGIAQELTDSYSIAQINQCERYGGAIAGEVKDKGELSNNYFVNTGTAGIDRVSYDGIAQEISYEEMRQREDIPQQFQSFTVTFLLDEQVVGTLERQYGELVSSRDFPQVKDKKDCYVLWETTEIAAVKGNETIEGTYTPYQDLLESTQTDKDHRPVLLAEGKFRQGDELLAEDISEEVNVKKVVKSADSWLATLKKREVLGAWSVTIPGNDKEEYTIRYRVGDSDGTYRVYVKTGDRWKRTDALRSGKHLLISVKGTACKILVVQ